MRTSIFARSLLLYTAAAVLSAAFAVLAFRLWRADLDVPLQEGGDAIISRLWLLNLMETGWYANSDRAAAPYGFDMNDFPVAEAVHFLLIRVIALGGGDVYRVCNLFFLSTFVLSALSGTFVLRQLGARPLPALAAGLLFAFLPYHFLRGQSHLFLSAYYLVPLSLLSAIWLLRGELSPQEDGKWPRGRWAIALLATALTSSGGIYYAFFGCFFLMTAGLIRACRSRSRGPLFLGAALCAVVSAGTVLNLLPSILYRLREGRNPQVAARHCFEADAYSLHLAQILMPRPDNRIPALRAVSKTFAFNSGRTAISYESAGSVGVLGLIGLAAAFLACFGRREGPGESNLLSDLGTLAVCGVLLANTSGFGSLFATFVSPMIRCYGRISVLIAFLGIASFAILLDRLLARCQSPSAQRLGWAACLIALAFGLFEQTSQTDIPNHAGNKKEHLAFKAFAAEIEASLPQGAMVFQLPFIEFPEVQCPARMCEYDHFRLVLQTRKLRCSHGGVKGRPTGEWLRHLAALPVGELVEELALMGYEGVHLDRFGLTKEMKGLEKSLRSLLEESPLECANGRDVFFPLRRFRERFKARLAPAEWEKRKQQALTPVRMVWESPFRREELPDGPSRFRLCRAGAGRMLLENQSSEPTEVRLAFGLRTRLPFPCRFSVSGAAEGHTETLAAGASATCLFRVVVPPGRHPVQFAIEVLPQDGKSPPPSSFEVVDPTVTPARGTVLSRVTP